MSHQPVGIDPFGDRAFMIRFEGPPSVELTAVLAGIAEAAAKLPGVVDAAPGLTSVLVESDSPGSVEAQLDTLMSSVTPTEGSDFEVPVTYDGPDFQWACEHLGLPPGKLIALHSDPLYDVRLLGSPGFIYLSEVAEQIALPRLEEPRKHVPAGSVGIGGKQAGIYGMSRPGGWRIIGTTSAVPRVRPGDRVRFVPV